MHFSRNSQYQPLKDEEADEELEHQITQRDLTFVVIGGVVQHEDEEEGVITQYKEYEDYEFKPLENPPRIWLLERGSLRHCFAVAHDDPRSLRATMICYTGLMMTLVLCLLSLTLYGILYATSLFTVPQYVMLGGCGVASAVWLLLGLRAFYAIWGKPRETKQLQRQYKQYKNNQYQRLPPPIN